MKLQRDGNALVAKDWARWGINPTAVICSNVYFTKPVAS